MDVAAIRSGASPSGPTDPTRLIQAARRVNQSGALGRNRLVLLVDSQTRRTIIRVEDRETHELVLQVPPEYVLRLARDLRVC